MIHCPNCDRMTGYKRALGWGTFFAVIITFGFWIFAIPFYPKRCIRCGLKKGSRATSSLSASVNFYSNRPQVWYKTWWGILMIIVSSAAIVTALIGGKGNELQSQPSAQEAAPKQSEKPANPTSETLSEGNIQEGKEIADHILVKYPTACPVNPDIEGLATPQPVLAFWLPEEEWNNLSTEQQTSLTRYVQSLISTVRNNPEDYIYCPKTAPIYPTFVDKAHTLNNNDWEIIIGPINNGEGVMDRTVAKG
jgi:hypothetical protein